MSDGSAYVRKFTSVPCEDERSPKVHQKFQTQMMNLPFANNTILVSVMNRHEKTLANGKLPVLVI